MDTGPRLPYPGLRPFQAEETEIFFGREAHTDELLRKLQDHRFLGVVGPSGCGKSSLVRAGLIPALETGYMASAGSRWRTAKMRPGSRSRLRLARALFEPEALGAEVGDDEDAKRFVEAALHRGPFGLVRVLEEIKMPQDTNLLILVDQFEEIFRFHGGASEEGEAFVSLLLETVRHRECPVYVVLTMRSDYLGHCAVFEGLPEALNEGQYLTPRLSRREKEAAIVGPARVFGGEVAPDLLNRILNDMGPAADQLPLMQHLMLRMWLRHRGPLSDEEYERLSEGEPADAPAGPTLTLDDYLAVGTLEEAISQHANEAYAKLGPEQKRLAEILFRSITGGLDDSEDTRRPVPLQEVAAVARVNWEQVRDVVDAFRASECSFVTPALPEALYETTILDLSHESLIRQWDRLREWAQKESESAWEFQRIEEWAIRWKEQQGGLWGDPDLTQALEWWQNERPNDAWAKRYGGNVSLAREFLDASQRVRDRWANTRRAGVLGLAFLAIVALVTALMAWGQSRAAAAESREANAWMFTRAAEQLAADPEGSVLMSLLALTEVAGRRDSRAAPEAEAALRRGLNGMSDFSFFLPPSQRLRDVQFDDSSTRLTILGAGVSRHDLASGSELFSLRPPGDLLAMAPGGDAFLLETADGSYEVWDVEGMRRNELPLLLPSSARLATFSPTANRVAVLTYGDVRLFDTNTGDLMWSHEVDALDISALAFAPGGEELAVAGRGNVLILAVADASEQSSVSFPGIAEKQILEVAIDTTYREVAVTLDSDSRVLIGSRDATGDTIQLSHPSYVRSLTYSPDGSLLATAGPDGVVRLWDTASLRVVREIRGQDETPAALRFSPDGTRLALAGVGGSIRIWNVLPDVLLRIPFDDVLDFGTVFSRDGRTAYTVGYDLVQRWDVEAREPLGDIASPRETIVSTAVSPDGLALALGDAAGHVLLWDTSLGSVWDTLGEAGVAPHGDQVRGLAFSPAGDRLVSVGGDSTAIVWDLGEGVALAQAQVQNVDIQAVSWSGDGRLIATAGFGSLKLLEPGSLAAVDSLPVDTAYINVVAFSPGGDRLFAGYGDGTVRIWQVGENDDALAAQVPEEPRRHDGLVTAFAFSPETGRFATASADGTVNLHLSTASATVRELPSLGSPVDALAFAGDGETVLTAERTGLTRAQPTDLEVILSQARAKIHRSLTDEECESYLASSACPASVEALLVEGRSLGRDGIEETARRRLRDAARLDGRLPRMPDAELRQSSARYHFARGVELAQVDSLERAVAEFELARELDPDVGSFGTRDDAEHLAGIGLLTRAWERARGGDLSGAMATADTLREFDPDWRDMVTEDELQRAATESLQERARTAAASGALSEALRMLTLTRGAGSGGPSPALEALLLGREAVMDSARALADQGQTDDAREWLELLLDFAQTNGLGDWLPYSSATEEAGRLARGTDVSPEARAVLDEAAPLIRRISSVTIANGRLQRASQEIDQALGLMSQARALDSDAELEASEANTLCWFGALLGAATEVLHECDVAVTRSSLDNGDYAAFVDSRGVARAMSGDLEGAIRDFQVFVAQDDAGSLEERDERRVWLEALQRGENPLQDPGVREKQLQYSAVYGTLEPLPGLEGDFRGIR